MDRGGVKDRKKEREGLIENDRRIERICEKSQEWMMEKAVEERSGIFELCYNVVQCTVHALL